MSRPPPDDLEHRLTAILAQPEGSWSEAIDALCRDHPEHASLVRQRLIAACGLRDVGQHPASDRDPLPDRVGPYRILSLLGEGGMGTVYIAEQHAPVRRRVAVKVVKPGMDSKRVLARFDAERQALAMMSHPHIAKVLDAGTTERGQPYFVMDLVKGIPITDYCDKNRLGVRERVELLQQICSGVQHAHLKGIIHRDLKPTNILVEVQDDRPIARIIDFGLARATDHHLTAHTLFTEQGQILGTPEYMSPEQAEMTGADIDTRTDVYSLGVLLYELLTGELPLTAKALRSAGPVQMQRMIREETPAAPSVRVRASTSSEHAAQRRKTTTITLHRELRGELDWIVMKALEKDRTRRYQSPSELSADLDRHLRGEPVLAGAPSLRYRLGKFLRRYRGPVLAGSALVLTLAVGFLTTATLYFDARAKERVVTDQAARLEVMADHNQLRDLLLEVDQLWPEDPVLLPRMNQWISRASALASRLPLFRERLESLRRLARQVPGDELLREQGSTPLGRIRAQLQMELQDLAARPGESGEGADLTQRIRALTAQLQELERETPTPRRFVAASAEDQLQLDTLERLIADLESLQQPGTGAIVRISRRKDFAHAVSQAERDGSAWKAVSQDLARSEKYRGASIGHLKPQKGLVPLGKDPTSGLWEFAHQRSGAIPTRDKTTGHLDLADDSLGLVFVLLPGGRTTVGAQREDRNQAAYEPFAEANETPVEVNLAPFFLSKFELTQGQWIQLSEGDNPSKRLPGSSLVSLRNPVERVDALSCERVLRHHGLLLPTDAQWEYACRAGTTTVWYTGNQKESLRGHVNLADVTAEGLGWPAIQDWLDDGAVFDKPVGSYQANPFGLHDMVGNVYEWCRDCIEPRGATRTLPNGDGAVQNQGTERLLRGSAYDRPHQQGRSAKRQAIDPLSRFDNVGLRPARPIDP